MELLKPLILGWSIVWSAFVISIGRINDDPSRFPFIFLNILTNHEDIKYFLIYFIPFYIFIMWLIGCLILIGLSLLWEKKLRRFFDP